MCIVKMETSRRLALNERGLCGKVKYSQREAGIVINSMRSSRYHHNKKYIPCRKYWCEIFRLYHVTHEIKQREDPRCGR